MLLVWQTDCQSVEASSTLVVSASRLVRVRRLGGCVSSPGVRADPQVLTDVKHNGRAAVLQTVGCRFESCHVYVRAGEVVGYLLHRERSRFDSCLVV